MTKKVDEGTFKAPRNVKELSQRIPLIESAPQAPELTKYWDQEGYTQHYRPPCPAMDQKSTVCIICELMFPDPFDDRNEGGIE